MRKEFLLGTTALLVGAVAMPDYVSAEEPLRLQVHGFKNEFFSVGSVDSDVGDFNNTGEFSEGEIQFRGETALDNGLTVGVQVELEADSRGDQIDEAYAYVKGDFGKIVAGGENLANYNTFWGVVAPSVGVPINSGWITVWVPQPAGSGLGFRSTGLTTNVDVGNDENSISYYSPRFAGFQFTGGYA
ncbi:MAG: porin, partial [Kiloniellaceae bacterium]